MSIEQGSRIKVKNYNDDQDPHKVDGASGTIIVPHYNYWEVELDESISGIKYWLLSPDEMEILDD